MIINKEQIDTVDQNGNLAKALIISYVNKDGNISFLKWIIPESEMFEWQYTNRANADKPFQVFDNEKKEYVFNADGTPKMVQWKSYDNKWVRKVPTNKNLSDSRINEILNSWGPSIEAIHDANTPVTWSCDIETDVSEEGFSSPETATCAINTIAITRFPQTIVFGRKPLSENEQHWIQESLENYSDLTKGYKFEYRCFSSEIQMLKAFIEFIKPIPAITGWNFWGYDWQYINNRCANLGIDISSLSPTGRFETFKLNRKNVINVKLPLHRIIYDYMAVYRQWDRTIEVKENDTLDWVSSQVLDGVKKVEHEWGFGEFYAEHYKEYVFYNSVDTILVERIDQKLKTAQVWIMLASELKISLYDAFSTILPAETVMTNFVYNEYKVVPKKQSKPEEESEGYVGAFVWPTQPGIYKYIGGLDFASLYPTTMRQFQISPESFMFKDKDYVPKADEIKTCSGAVYKKDPNAVIPAILTHYYAKRKDAKKDRKQADTDREALIKIYEERFGVYE